MAGATRGVKLDQVDGIAENAARAGGGDGGQHLQAVERQKGGTPAALLLQIVDGRAGIVPAAGDDVLQRAAQGRLDGFFQVWRHAQQGGHRAQDPAQLAAASPGALLGCAAASTLRTPLP